jgi:hypothetical protein
VVHVPDGIKPEKYALFGHQQTPVSIEQRQERRHDRHREQAPEKFFLEPAASHSKEHQAIDQHIVGSTQSLVRPEGTEGRRGVRATNQGKRREIPAGPGPTPLL